MPIAKKYCKLTFSYRTVLPDDDIVFMNDNGSQQKWNVQQKCSLFYVGTGNRQTSKKTFSFLLSLSSHQGREFTCRILLLAVSKSIKHFFFQFQNHHLSTKIGKTNKHKIQSKYFKAKKDTNPRVISGKPGSSASRPDHDEIEETRIQLVSEILWQNIGVPLKLLRERLASFYAGPRIINSANNLLTLRSQKNNIPESDNKKASIATDMDPSGLTDREMQITQVRTKFTYTPWLHEWECLGRGRTSSLVNHKGDFSPSSPMVLTQVYNDGVDKESLQTNI